MKKYQTAIIVIVSLLVAALAYWYFFMNNSNEPTITSDGEISGAQAKFEALASQLPASFNTSILSDPKFTALINISVPITPEPSGRLDPLAPIPGVGGE